MLLTIKIEHKQSGVVVVDDSILSNVDFLKNYFSGTSQEAIEFKVEDINYLNRETQLPLEYEDESIPLALMLADIDNENSFLFGELRKLFAGADIVQTKIDMLKFMLNKYIDCVFNNRYNSRDDFHQFASYYYKGYYFKYRLPLGFVKKSTYEGSLDAPFFDARLDLAMLSTDELATYFIPLYYREIGGEDREIIRNNKELMSHLAEHWFDRAQIGMLD